MVFLNKEERLTTINNIITKIDNLLIESMKLHSCELCIHNDDGDKGKFCITCPFIFKGRINWERKNENE